jgi:hypothetical protein
MNRAGPHRAAPLKLALADLPPAWPATVREIVQREGVAMRAGAGGSIEVQSINTGEFMPLLLPGGAMEFATAAERDAVLAQIVGRG